MEVKKMFAFLLMGSHYIPSLHHARFETGKQITYIVTVNNFEEACKKVVELKKEGVGAMELCGAFGEDKAQKIVDILDGKVAVGFVTHFKYQDILFEEFFNNF